MCPTLDSIRLVTVAAQQSADLGLPQQNPSEPVASQKRARERPGGLISIGHKLGERHVMHADNDAIAPAGYLGQMPGQPVRQPAAELDIAHREPGMFPVHPPRADAECCLGHVRTVRQQVIIARKAIRGPGGRSWLRRTSRESPTAPAGS